MSYQRPIALHETLGRQTTASRLSAGVPTGILARLVAGLRQTARRIHTIHVEHVTARALARLNDHQLKDIGIERGFIPEVARAAAWSQLTVAGLDGTGDPFDPRRIRP